MDEPPPPPPQPAMSAPQNTRSIAAQPNCKFNFPIRFRLSANASIAISANVASNSSANGFFPRGDANGFFPGGVTELVCAVVVIVRVVPSEGNPATTLTGRKEFVVSAGKPE